MLKICAIALMLFGCNQKNDNLSELVIKTTNGDVTYYVETATTKEEMAQGLMDRKELRADSGMIFDLKSEEGVAIWMKDTYIPLDILFVNKQGKIVWIHQNAEPLSTNLIKPLVKDPLSAIVELNGGDVKKHNIKVGDIINHKIIKN